MIVRFAKGNGGQRCFYTRTKGTRLYHVFDLSRIVDRNGSAWRLVIGPIVFVFGLK